VEIPSSQTKHKYLPKNNENILLDKRQRNGGEKQKYKEIAI
jgi:hypothetical protein